MPLVKIHMQFSSLLEKKICTFKLEKINVA